MGLHYRLFGPGLFAFWRCPLGSRFASWSFVWPFGTCLNISEPILPFGASFGVCHLLKNTLRTLQLLKMFIRAFGVCLASEAASSVLEPI